MKKQNNSRLLIIESAETDIVLKLETIKEVNESIKESIKMHNKNLDRIRELLRNI
jgi:hypothetical protein